MPAFQKDGWHWNPHIMIDAASSGSVELRTTGGVAVGAAADEVASSAFSTYTDPDGNTAYLVEADHAVPVDYDPANPDDTWNTVHVTVSPAGVVLRIVAPYPFGNVL